MGGILPYVIIGIPNMETLRSTISVHTVDGQNTALLIIRNIP